MTKKSSFLILYGDYDFDGRAKRMFEVADAFGSVFVLDASDNHLNIGSRTDRRRVVLQPHWGSARRHLAFWSQVILEVCRRRPDLVYSENYFTTLPACFAARLVGARYIYDAYELIVPEPNKKTHIRDRLWYFFEWLTVSRAELVIAANSERAEIMATHYRLPRLPTYMRNIPQQHKITAKHRAAVVKKYPTLAKSRRDEVIILYQGDVTFARRLAVFIEVLVQLPVNYRLVVVGDGEDLVLLEKMANKRLAKNRFTALGRVPNDLLPSITVQADIGIVTYSYDGWNNVYCAPNKVFEYALAGLPVIASDQPPLKALVTELGIGALFGIDDDETSIANKIRSIAGRLSNEKIAQLTSSYSNLIESDRVREKIAEILK